MEEDIQGFLRQRIPIVLSVKVSSFSLLAPISDKFLIKLVAILTMDKGAEIKLYVLARYERSRMTQPSNEDLEKNAASACKRIAGFHKIVAACAYGPRICGYAHQKSDEHVLLVLSGYQTRLKCYTEPMDGVSVFILAVDQRIFERDVRSGWLGEFVAEKVILPYKPLISKEYLQLQEVRAKKRIVWELCGNIVSEFPELCHELLIKPEYFMYESMMRRARLFPPITYNFLNMFRGDLREKNIQLIMDGYLEAFDELAKESQIALLNGYVKITQKLIRTIRSQKPRLPPLIKSIQRTVFLHVLSVISKMTTPLKQDQEAFVKSHEEIEAEKLVFQLEEPEKHLFLPTPLGPVSLSERTNIEDFMRKVTPGGTSLNIEIEQLGGVLNSVYLLKYHRNHKERKVVVKRFKDWFGLKWFPLSLWTLGTKNFAVLGRTRLEREYSMNQFLRNHGFPVPKVLDISHQERLIFEDFVEGETMVKTIKRIILSREKATEDGALVREVGRKVAEAHRLGVALGDCKPENIIVAEDGKTYFVDLEQATRNGNQVWDVAEFIYYSGHYVLPISPSGPAELIAKEFIGGYLEAGGERETVKSAASARYTKVFSIFTPLHVLLAISNVCGRMSKG